MTTDTRLLRRGHCMAVTVTLKVRAVTTLTIRIGCRPYGRTFQGPVRCCVVTGCTIRRPMDFSRAHKRRAACRMTAQTQTYRL